MQFYSTKKNTKPVSLKQAVLKGLAADNGLFMPERIPALPEHFFKQIHQLTLQEIAFEVTKNLFEQEIPDEALKQIIEESLNFEIPLHHIHDNIHCLELFHGPTLAFKDVGARFMARLLSYFLKDDDTAVTVLVATSGDTGSAVANGFLGVPGIKVVILYPSGKVSEIQEKQLTTLGHNIEALEVQGTFDDCQALVKEAFLDQELNQRLTLTSANSINIARLIPQSFYYFHAYAQLPPASKVVFSVPSGNFGNLTAGLIAKRMGLPIHKFIAATNANDIVPKYLRDNVFQPRPSVKTMSNAMDVGNPSNFDRILDLYAGNHDKISHDIDGFSIDDQGTRSIMKMVKNNYGYVLDPHGAIGYAALKDYIVSSGEVSGIFLETAHPSKFLNEVEPVIEDKIDIPSRLKSSMAKEKHSTIIKNSFKELTDLLS